MKNDIIVVDVNGRVICGSEQDGELVKAELSRQGVCCLEVSQDCTGCGCCSDGEL